MTTDLVLLRELRAKASPGLWTHKTGWEANGDRDDELVHRVWTSNIDDLSVLTAENAALIVALHNAAPAMFDELEALRARVKALEEGIIGCGIGVMEMHPVAPPKISKEDAEAMRAVIAAHNQQEEKP